MTFKNHKAGIGGWSEWVFPTKKYLFKCCDCGLVHEIEFKTFIEKERKRNIFTVIPLPKEVRAMFRARRFNKLKK